MRELGWLNDEASAAYFSDGSDLKGLSDPCVPALEAASGSLADGFSCSVDLAEVGKTANVLASK